MKNLFFIAILIGAAGVVGGIGTGNMAGTIAAAAIHAAGIVGMALETRMTGDDETMEDKQKIIEAFAGVMKMTRKYDGMVSLEYVKEGRKELAVATFENGGVKRADITTDSGWGTLIDILKQI